MNHYKSWSGLKKQLTDLLCEPLRNRVSYYLTRYHNVHNSYGRAAILLDERELVCFSWVEMYTQENDISQAIKIGSYDMAALNEKWAANAVYSDMNFLSAATDFVNMHIDEALASDNYIIRIFAIMDRRTGKRRIEEIERLGQYRDLPEWVQQFYQLRLGLRKD